MSKNEENESVIEIIKMLELTNPILAGTKVTEYVNGKLKETGSEDIPCCAMYSKEELFALSRAEISRMDLAFNALCLGFANGIKYIKNQ